MSQCNNCYLPISMTGFLNPDSYCLPSISGRYLSYSLIDDSRVFTGHKKAPRSSCCTPRPVPRPCNFLYRIPNIVKGYVANLKC